MHAVFPRKLATLLAASAFFATPCLAQWSGDPGSPLIIAGGAGDQGVPVVRPTIDGGMWIAFMDNSAGTGYRPVIQRLNSIGQAMLPGNGVVLANRHNTATFVFDMKVDPSGNAIVAFDDDSTGATMVTVQKVLPNGSLPWGSAGLQMPGSNGVIGPRVTACADGSYVCGWQITSSSAATLYYQRIASNGTFPAGGAWTYADTSDTGHYLAFSDLQTGGSGNDFVALWIRGHVYSAINSSKGLQAQKFDATNTGLWNGGLPVDVAPYARPPATPTHSIQNGYFPSMIPDGQGGAVVGWYDIGTNREDRFQHVEHDGTLRFGPDGFTAATTPGELQLAGGVGFDGTNDEFVMAFERSDGLQSVFGLGVQRVDSAGNRLFGSSGAVILPTSGSHSAFINAVPGPERSTYVVWSQYLGANGPMQIEATRLDAAGAPIWTSAIVDVANNSSNKSRLTAFASIGANRVMCAWNDGPSGNNDVLAANFNFDGSIGAPMCPADLDNDGVLSNGGNPDGGVEINDLLFFLDAFESGNVLGDLDDGSGTGAQDGAVEISDLLFFLVHFEGGC